MQRLRLSVVEGRIRYLTPIHDAYDTDATCMACSTFNMYGKDLRDVGMIRKWRVHKTRPRRNQTGRGARPWCQQTKKERKQEATISISNNG